MNYKQKHDQLIDKILKRQHSMGNAPDPRITKQHRVVPKAVVEYYPNPMVVHAAPHEVYLLRLLLTRIYPGNHGVQVAFKKTQDDYFAKTWRDVIKAVAPDLIQMEIEDREQTLLNVREGCWGADTNVGAEQLLADIRALKHKKKQCGEALAQQAAAYNPTFGVKYTHEVVDEEALYNQALLNEAYEAFNPKVRLGEGMGKSWTFGG